MRDRYLNEYFRTESQENPDLFKDVTTEDKYLEAQVKAEYKSERERLLREKKTVEDKLLGLDDTIKQEKARRKFVPKAEFFLREQIEANKMFIFRLIDNFKNGEAKDVEKIIDSEKWRLICMDQFLSFPNQDLDILYDYSGMSTYDKIKKNVSSEGRDKALRELKVKKEDWVLLRDSEPE